MRKGTKKTEPAVEELEIIQPDAIVGIKMSTSYYNRIYMLYSSLIAEKTTAEMQVAYEQIKDKKIVDNWVYNLETMIILINEFQKNAKEEKKTKMVSKEEYQKIISKEIEPQA